MVALVTSFGLSNFNGTSIKRYCSLFSSALCSQFLPLVVRPQARNTNDKTATVTASLNRNNRSINLRLVQRHNTFELFSGCSRFQSQQVNRMTLLEFVVTFLLPSRLNSGKTLNRLKYHSEWYSNPELVKSTLRYMYTLLKTCS